MNDKKVPDSTLLSNQDEQKSTQSQPDDQLGSKPQLSTKVHQESANRANKTTTNKRSTETNKSKAKSGGGIPWFGIINLLLILTIAAVGSVAGFYFYQQVTLQARLTAEKDRQLEELLQDPLIQISALKQQHLHMQANMGQTLQQLTTEQIELQERVVKIAQRSPNHWMAEEALYLVNLAGNKLWLEGDPTTATSLLKAADNRIESMKDPALTPLRKALSRDIRAVASIKKTDIAGTALVIDSIIEKLDILPLNRVKPLAEQPLTEDEKITSSLADWRSNLAKSWKTIMNDFVVIRKRTAEAAPLLEPDQQWYLVENIRHKLMLSQLALYRFEQVNYRQSINMAKSWLQQYFDLDDNKVKETISALEALSTFTIHTPSINQFRSTQLLQQLTTHGNLLLLEQPVQEKPLIEEPTNSVPQQLPTDKEPTV